MAAEARPASADRLVPARGPLWLLTLLQPRNRWREESKGRREIAPCSAFGTSVVCGCRFTVHPTRSGF